MSNSRIHASNVDKGRLQKDRDLIWNFYQDNRDLALEEVDQAFENIEDILTDCINNAVAEV